MIAENIGFRKLAPDACRGAQVATTTLQSLYFGRDDAESDFLSGGLLRAGFLRTRAFEEALVGRKTLIVGRKGSGKSAIALMLNDSLQADDRGALITPDEISSEEIRRFHLPGIQLAQSKQLIWRYVFAVRYARHILRVAKQRTSAADIEPNIRAIRQFLIDNGEVEDLTVVERFWKVVERLRVSITVKAFNQEAEISKDTEQAPQGLQVDAQLREVERALRDTAAKLHLSMGRETFHILVDQIEKVWSDNQESDAMVVGLLQAGKEAQGRLGAVLCTVFLRTDIYEKLQFADRDKFRGDEFRIDWTKDSLTQLVVARARASSNANLLEQKLWGELFPHSLDGQPTPDFLVSRTLMRPRDIIQLCNACCDTAKVNGHASIKDSDVKQALTLYSGWKLSDLQNEWAINYPFLAELFVLLSNTACVLPKTVFERRLAQVEEDLEERYPVLGKDAAAFKLLSVLYSIGLLGVVRDGEAKFSYESQADSGLDGSDHHFSIHPGFRDALRSTSTLNVRQFEPLLDELRGAIRGEVGRNRPVLRGTRDRRFARSSLYEFDRLIEVALASSLPVELREEIVASCRTMQVDLESTLELSDGDGLTVVVSRITKHLRDIHANLSLYGWDSSSKDVLVATEQLRFAMEQFTRRGFGDEYVSPLNA